MNLYNTNPLLLEVLSGLHKTITGKEPKPSPIKEVFEEMKKEYEIKITMEKEDETNR